MKKSFATLFFLTMITYANACTNLIATKGATTDGSVFVTYTADDYGMFTNLCHYPAGTHAKVDRRGIFYYYTHESHGFLTEAPVTYNVIGNINEYQARIGEKT